MSYNSDLSLRFGKFKLSPLIAIAAWFCMMLTGTGLINATLLAVAVAFGLMSVDGSRGIRTIHGFLNFVLISKFLLIAILLKTLTLQAADSNLQAPRTTCQVMALGFCGLYFGTLLFRAIPKPKGVVRAVEDSHTYLWITIVFAVLSLVSNFVVLANQIHYDVALQGGFWGFAHQLEVGSSFSLVLVMYYVWSCGSTRFLSHPIVVATLVVLLALGIAATTKQALMEPLLCYVAIGFIRYGLKSKAVWGIVAAGGFLYMTIVYPYSQYVRDHGGRDGTLRERMEAIQYVLLNIATNPAFRQGVDSSIKGDGGYLGKPGLEPLSRLAMIGEADRLIYATDATQSYSGWQTINDGFLSMVPSFFGLDRPDQGVGNILGHIGGELASDDYSTQISYGFMANLYNAFGLPGVFWGTLIFIALFYYVLHFWFSTPYLGSGFAGTSAWYLFLALSFEHGLVEGPLANDLAAFVYLSGSVGAILLGRYVGNTLRFRRIGSGYLGVAGQPWAR